MRLLELTDSTTGQRVVIVAQNVFALKVGVNELNQKPETRIFSAGDDFFGVVESISLVEDELAKTP